MWPRKIPRDVLDDQRLGTECKVYEKLRDELDDSFVVYHSSPWIGVNQQGQEIDGECDFVVAHPDLGLLAIEVKGGQINYDPQTKQWTSKDRYGCEHSIKNPVNQASTSKHKLVEKLKRFRSMKSVFIHAKHGVILPHATKPPRDLGADKPLDLFCFASEYTQNLGNWVVKRFGTKSPNQKSGNSFGKRGLKALEMLLAQPFQLQAPLGSYLSEDDQEINTLTQEQFEILNYISDISQVAIQVQPVLARHFLRLKKPIGKPRTAHELYLFVSIAGWRHPCNQILETACPLPSRLFCNCATTWPRKLASQNCTILKKWQRTITTKIYRL